MSLQAGCNWTQSNFKFNLQFKNIFKCDKCAPLHYGLDESGCKQCKPCPAPGQVCDAVTGECVCPPNTEGEICQVSICGAGQLLYNVFSAVPKMPGTTIRIVAVSCANVMKLAPTPVNVTREQDNVNARSSTADGWFLKNV